MLALCRKGHRTSERTLTVLKHIAYTRNGIGPASSPSAACPSRELRRALPSGPSHTCRRESCVGITLSLLWWKLWLEVLSALVPQVSVRAAKQHVTSLFLLIARAVTADLVRVLWDHSDRDDRIPRSAQVVCLERASAPSANVLCEVLFTCLLCYR